jgi:hypothetical protein
MFDRPVGMLDAIAELLVTEAAIDKLGGTQHHDP